jgi:hypothetical protein
MADKGGRGDLTALVTTGKLSRRKRWPTPQASDSKGGAGQGPAWTGGPNLRTAAARYPTPRSVQIDETTRLVRSGLVIRVCTTHLRSTAALPRQRNRLTWPTPLAGSGGGWGVVRWREPGQPQNLPNALATVDPSLIGGQLNPPWVEWLMGFPENWTVLPPRTDSAPLETPSSPPSARTSDAS